MRFCGSHCAHPRSQLGSQRQDTPATRSCSFCSVPHLHENTSAGREKHRPSGRRPTNIMSSHSVQNERPRSQLGSQRQDTPATWSCSFCSTPHLRENTSAGREKHRPSGRNPTNIMSPHSVQNERRCWTSTSRLSSAIVLSLSLYASRRRLNLGEQPSTNTHYLHVSKRPRSFTSSSCTHGSSLR